MKKVIIICSLFLLCSCSSTNDKIDVSVSKSEIKTVERKTYYSYRIKNDPYIQVFYDNKGTNSKINKVDVESNNIVKTSDNNINDINLNDQDKVEINDENKNIEEQKNEENYSEEVNEEDECKGNNDEIKKEDEEQQSEDPIEKEEVNEDVKFETNVINTIKVQEVTEERKGYYSSNGVFLGESNVKVIDVSHHQGYIDWDSFASSNSYYGVILRIGYYNTMDSYFERNISELKRLNIPYGIYLFSYSIDKYGASVESDFTNRIIDNYNLNPTLGIFYDIESWSTKTSSSDNISKQTYNSIITTYINNVSSHINNKYKVKVYSGRWYAMNRLDYISKSYVDWVAEYNSTCKYDSSYSMWQYTSKGSVPGINGYVDISYLF